MPATIGGFVRYTRDVFTLVACGQITRFAVLLAENPERVYETLSARIGFGVTSADAGETPLFALPEDEDSAIEVAEKLLAAGADPTRGNHAGQTAAARPALAD